VNNIKIHNYIYSGVRQLKQAFNKDRDSINKTFNKDIPPNKALYKTFLIIDPGHIELILILLILKEVIIIQGVN